MPESAAAKARVARHSRYTVIDKDGDLWLLGDRFAPKKVPPMKHRNKILRETFKELGYPSGPRLYLVIKQTFAWNGMYSDCVTIARNDLARTKQLARFKPPPFLIPTCKGSAPF